MENNFEYYLEAVKLQTADKEEANAIREKQMIKSIFKMLDSNDFDLYDWVETSRLGNIGGEIDKMSKTEFKEKIKKLPMDKIEKIYKRVKKEFKN